MFRHHVTILPNGVISVNELAGSSLGDTTLYETLEDVPEELKATIKQMMWVNPSDPSLTENLGIRIGENIFWIL